MMREGRIAAVFDARAHHPDETGRRSSLELRDGTMMSFLDEGAGDVIVLVHGWAVTAGYFDEVASELSTQFRVIRPDLRAHGLTPSGDLPLEIGTLAADLAELLEQLDLDNAVVLGWSMGALVAWRHWLDFGSERVCGHVIEDMTPRVLNSADWQLGMSNGLDAAASARATRAMERDWQAYAEAFTPKILSRERGIRDQALIAQIGAEIRIRDPQAMAALWSAMVQEDFRAELPAMTLPTLVIYGERSDAYGPETSRYLVDSLPNAERKGFSRSGHAPHLEEPEEFSEAIIAFMHRVQADRDARRNFEGSTP